MTAEQRDLFLEIADEYAIEAEPYDGQYSGRGMFGASTLAVVVHDLKTAAVVAHEVAERTGEPFEFMTDNLGRDFVVY